MQAGPAVPAPANPFDANTATLLRHQRRQSHRSASVSSGSVITVQPPTSSHSRVRSQSPAGDVAPAASYTTHDSMSAEPRRRKSLAVDPSEYHATEISASSTNRWSHSTTSSISSTNKRRNRSSSGAVLSSIAGQAFSPRPKPSAAPDASTRASPQKKNATSRRASLTGSPTRSRRAAKTDSQLSALTALPPLHTTPSLTDPNDTESPSTTQTIPTPSTYPYQPENGFLENDDYSYGMAKPSRVTAVRAPAAPMSVANHKRRSSGSKARATAKSTDPPDSYSESGPRARTAGDGSGNSRKPRVRERVEKDKKAMLSKALQKANTAVLLDNAQNYEGALEAYGDACNLLTQVMERTSGEDDKRKLDAIRVTYSNRMEELRELAQGRPSISAEKNLPARPISLESSRSPTGIALSPIDTATDDAAIQIPTQETAFDFAPRLSFHGNDRDSFFERTMQAVDNSASFHADSHDERYQQEPAVAAVEDEPEPEPEPQPQMLQKTVHLPPLDHAQYVPRPLSPKRPHSPPLLSQPDENWLGNADFQSPEDQVNVEDSTKDPTSWLDTIDETGSSCSDSVHSVDDLQGMRRKHIRGMSGNTDPDFDAAFDAAVEAAYNEGLEPDLEARKKRLTALRRTQHESIHIPAGLNTRNVTKPDPEDEEEERILDEMTNDFSHTFNFDLQSKSALPRTSDSSGYSRSTWQSSQLSDRATNATSLSTVAEDGLANRLSKTAPATRARGESAALPPPTAPPTGALPQLPPTGVASQPATSSRRQSGMNSKQLKIETLPKADVRKRASTFHRTAASPLAEDEEFKNFSGPASHISDNPESMPLDQQSLQSPPSLRLYSAVDESLKSADESTIEYRPSYEEVRTDIPATRPTLFRKNKSSSSLRERPEHTLLLASPDVEAGSGLITPMSSTFMSFAASKRNQSSLNSQRANLPSFSQSAFEGEHAGGGIYLFDTSLSSPEPQSLPPWSPLLSPLPTALEPCPEPFLLRPFWIMRCLAQTITHPRGGYLSNNLFVPREVWQTRGVKLKLVEDKIANCDLLTAALGKLAGVNTFDADAVMNELQNFEEVIERVQTVLTKKLGNDVGVHGIAGTFKDATASTTTSGAGNSHAESAQADKAAKSNSGKSYLSSWRKLRSKTSGAPLSSTSSHGMASQQTDKEKELHTIPSVPMTSFIPVERRGQKKETRNLSFDGVNKDYMGSLARLFDSVQIIDQIARQVEDPGLKHSSPTHVGLELSTRHAAEFFGFYICRFVLSDLGLLMDKFVKRGTEWVLA